MLKTTNNKHFYNSDIELNNIFMPSNRNSVIDTFAGFQTNPRTNNNHEKPQSRHELVERHNKNIEFTRLQIDL